ncbi:flagellar hook-associated protein FlgK [Roseicyclus sp.]|uniref:flagellar hook-associated protein FlgK n=1 Tax=Roseicyclus sp. TaxID=1914329 RepID=UPI003F6AB78E
MPGLFDIASSGIQAYREALAVTGQNIANINTEGYRRRGVDLSEISASQNDVTTISDQTGLGVRVAGISRAFDSFIAGRARDANSDFSQAEAYKAGLDTLEGALVPGDYDLGYFLAEFFDGLNGVAQAPADLASRTVALTKGSALAEGFVRLSQDLDDLRETIWQQTSNVTRDLNGMLVTLRNTQNQLIASGSATGASNALLDARDQTISEISTLVGVSVATAASGAATVTLGRSGNGPVLGTATQSGSLQVRKGDERLVFLAGQSPGLSETQQVSSGRLAGLSEAYRSVTEAMRSLDTLATRLADEFNQAHANGIDLNGKVGTALFSADGVFVEQSSTNLGRFSANATAPEVIDQIAGETRFVYSSKAAAWLSFDADGKATTHASGPITIGSVRINVTGTPADGDEFTLRAEIGSAAQMRFLLKQPQEFAGAGLLLSEADIGNTSRAALEATAIATQTPTGLTDVTQVLRDDLSTLSATALRQNGVLGVIPAGTASVELVSLGRQDSVTFSLTEAQTIAVSSLAITLNGTSYTFDLSAFQTYAGDQRGADAGDLADLLNAGRLTMQNGTRFSDLGLFAAGAEGNLTIARASSTGAITAATIDGQAGSVTTGLAAVSNLQVFTRDGRQIAGTALSQSDVISYLTEANGFLPEAEYRADLLNGADGIGYRGMEIIRRTTDGAALLTFSATGIDPSLRTGDAAAVPANPAGSLALTIGTEREVIEIPASLSAGLIAARINAAATDTGISAEASTRLALSDLPDGLVQFTLEADNETPVQIAANVTGGALDNLLGAINARSRDTGVVATLGSDPGRIVLVSDTGDDLVLGAISAGDPGFTATPITMTATARGTAVTLGGTNGATALRLGGDITLRGSQSFELDWQGASGTSSADPFTDGLMTRQVDPAGRWQDIAFHLSDGLDTAEADPEGLGATAAATQLSLNLSGLNGTGSLSAQIETARLSEVGSSAVAQAMAATLRGLGMVPTLEGSPVATQPADGTTVQVLLGDQSYVLSMVDGEIAVTGPEAGRITAFFEADNTLRVAATGGSLSGQILRLSPETPAVDAAAFGLGVAGASAGLNGRSVAIPVGQTDFTLDVVIDGVETTLNVAWTNNTVPAQFTFDPPQGVSLDIAASADGMVATLAIAGDSGIDDLRLRPSVDAHALGLVSADAEITLGAGGLRIASAGAAPVQLTASATSLVAERLSLRGLPNEELIVIATGSGARRIAASFGESQPSPTTATAFEIKVIDGPSRRVEIFERATGHSLATRTVADDGQFMAYGMRFELVGTFETGDSFYVKSNQDGSGDARNAMAMFALGDRNARTGLGGFGAEFATLVTTTGAEGRAADIAQSAAEARRDAAVELEAEYSGVNLDDEAARLLEQQQAYQALARVLRTAGDLLDTLLNAIS